MYIENIELRNFCCYEHSKVTFQHRGRGTASKAPLLPNVNLILGDNGAGKTALLRGLVLAVLGSAMQSGGLRPYMLVRRIGSEFDQHDPPAGTSASVQAKILLHTQDALISGAPTDAWSDEPTGSIIGQTVINRRYTTEEIVSTAHTNPSKWAPLKNDLSPAFFVAGYGASRRAGAPEVYDPNTLERSRSGRYQRVAGVFEDNTTLVPIRLWWNAMREQGHTDLAVKLINRLLPNGVSVSVLDSVLRGDILFAMGGLPLPFRVLSDGYRTLIGLVSDLLYHLAQVAPTGTDLTALHGVVMVDELDLFLHPTWQRIIVERLAETFPNLQFFITTHSPILAGTLQDQNITVLDQDRDTGAVTLRRSHERVFGLSADQILGSRYFGLSTSRAPAAEELLRHLAQRSSDGDETATEDYMRLIAEGFGPDDVKQTVR